MISVKSATFSVDYRSGKERNLHMPLPLIPPIAGALVGKAASGKEEKKIPVNGRVRKDGTRGKATLRKAPKRRH